MPVVTLPEGLVDRGSATSGFLQPGYYSSVNAPNNATLTLGIAGATVPAIYQFDEFGTGNGVRINVQGPVLLILNPGAGITIDIGNNTVVGNIAHPEWLQINMFTGNLTVSNNGELYGSVLNPDGSVSFRQGSSFTGGVTSKFLSVDNNVKAVSFSLPPPD
jgi:hypothetical protein